MTEYEIDFEYDERYIGEYGFFPEPPYWFKGDFYSLIRHLIELEVKYGVKVHAYKEIPPITKPHQ